MALLKFKIGEQSRLPAAYTEGAVYITTDEKAMYVDYKNGDELARIRIGQIQCMTSEEWETMQPPFSPEVFYYITNINALVRYNATEGKWVQINSTETIRKDIADLKTELYGADGKTGLKGDVATLKTKVDNLVSTGGEANLVNDVKVNGTSVVTDKVANITLGALGSKDKVAVADLAEDVTTKFTTIDGDINTLKTGVSNAATKTELQTAQSALQGEIDAAEQAIAGVDAKLGARFNSTDTVEKAVDALEETVGGHTTTIGQHTAKLNTLTTDVGTNTADITQLKKDVVANATAASAAQSTADKAESDAAAAQGTANTAVTNAATAQAAAEAAQSTADTNKTDISNLTNRVKTIEDNYATDAEVADVKTELEGKITAASNLAQQGVDNAAAAQGTADNALSKATTNATNIESLQTAVGNKVDTSTYTAKISELEVAIGTNATGVTEAKADAKAAQDKADANEDLIAGHDTRISGLESKLNNVANAMDFIGVSTTDPDTGIVTINDVIISGNTDSSLDTVNKGDVVIFGEKEFVYDGSKWVEFGDATGNASAITALTTRVTTAEGAIKTLQTDLDAAEAAIEVNKTDIAARYTKTEVDNLLTTALSWETF